MNQEEQLENQTKADHSTLWKWGLGIGILVLGLWITYLVYYLNCFNGLPTEEVTAGQFGDMFGSLNALLSGLALIGAAVAIIYQAKELEQTRKEIRAQTEALKNQQKEAERTRTEMQFQRNMNALYSQIEIIIKFDEGKVGAVDGVLANLPYVLKENNKSTLNEVNRGLKNGADVIASVQAMLRIANFILQKKEQPENGQDQFSTKRQLVLTVVLSNIPPRISSAIDTNGKFATDANSKINQDVKWKNFKEMIELYEAMRNET